MDEIIITYLTNDVFKRSIEEEVVNLKSIKVNHGQDIAYSGALEHSVAASGKRSTGKTQFL